MRTAAALALLALPVSAGAADPGPTRRFAVVAGSNRGAADRAPLRYAVADADRLAALLVQMGGVRAEDCTVLREPTRRALLDGLSGLRERAQATRAGGGRVDLVVYFSGHADDRGLMLGRELLPYAELRASLADVSADVGITILDACASGAITRLKGGQAHPAFLTDASTQVKGYAFLTSSTETEAAQESERLQGSFFTQALLTGLRGAADLSGDGRVTLGEAYQFAFAETLAQTTSTQGGAQHPAYDIKMAGTGDVVLTDVRQTSASLVLGPDYDGRFFVLGPHGHLVAELYKQFGRTVELGLEPGEYEVYFEQEQRLMTSSLKLEDGQRQELSREGLHPTRRLPTETRGGPAEAPPEDLLDGRTRVQLSFGITQISGSSTATTDLVRTGHGLNAVWFAHWIRPDVALEAGLGVTDVVAESAPAVDHVTGVFTALFGARYYPPVRGAFRPYASGAIGPFSEFGTLSTPGFDSAETRDTHFGGTLGGGVDIYFGRHYSLSLDGRVQFVSDRPTFFGLSLGVFGWTWGSR